MANAGDTKVNVHLHLHLGLGQQNVLKNLENLTRKTTSFSNSKTLTLKGLLEETLECFKKHEYTSKQRTNLKATERPRPLFRRDLNETVSIASND